MNSDFFKDKHVLVAGGAGFIGSHLISKLLLAGAKVRAADIKDKPQINDSRIEYVQCDLTRKEDCQKVVKGMDYVFMAAANTAGAAVMEHKPLVHVTPNVIMNGLMLESSHEAGVKKFLFISSNTVYPDLDTPMKEEDMKYGDVFYKYYFVAWMKQFSEVMCQMYAKGKSPMKTIIVRPANSYGPYSNFDPEMSHVIPALIRKVVERQNPLPVWGDGTDIKDFIYVEDLVEGMLLAMEKLETPDPVNLATGKQCTIKEILHDILEIDGYKDAKIEFDTSKPMMIKKRLISPEKAKAVLGFEAKTPLKDGLQKTISWYRSTL